MDDLYWIVENGQVRRATAMEAEAQIGGKGEGRIARDESPDGKVSVSTVCLCLDHRFGREGPPIIFETMIFGSEKYDDYQERYSTIAAARAGHKLALYLVKDPNSGMWRDA